MTLEFADAAPQISGGLVLLHGEAGTLWLEQIGAVDANGSALAVALAAQDTRITLTTNGDGYDDVVVGAWTYTNGPAEEGAAFIYFGGPGAFDTTADALIESSQVAGRYGVSVASGPGPQR